LGHRRTDRVRGTAELAQLFERAFSELSPELHITTMVVDGDQAACELSEHLVINGVVRVDQIAALASSCAPHMGTSSSPRPA
jgi:hypothetical protein